MSNETWLDRLLLVLFSLLIGVSLMQATPLWARVDDSDPNVLRANIKAQAALIEGLIRQSQAQDQQIARDQAALQSYEAQCPQSR